uniref:Peptidyl-prolyl isomerase CWC27 n=1 Tax=Ganoderma boninense TaxID=34458 RepID=A0A5K1JW88_9APHY|nr:Peptidyl-prolyl isomerase CWC27 [Ganoderma boninense]
MTFLPVNAMPEPEPPSILPRSPLDRMVGTQPESALLPSQASFVSGPDPPSRSDAGHLNSESADYEVSSLTPTTSTLDKPSMSPTPLSLSLPATSFLPLAVESDTDTDTYTDTDGESDAPSNSTVASSVPSPPCEFEDRPELDDLKIGSYFPPVSLAHPLMAPSTPHVHALSHEEEIVLASSLPTEAGQTPPLSVLFPSPKRLNRALPPPLNATLSGVVSQDPTESTVFLASLESSALPPGRPSITLPPGLVSSALTAESSLPATPLSVSRVLQKKLMLEALPSPALVPPSPFELEPHQRSGASPRFAQGVLPESASANHDHHVLIEKLEGLRVAEAEAESLSETPVSKAVSDAAADTLASATAIGGSPSPMLTLESMRVAWDEDAREGLAMAAARPGVVAVIAPSLSRRRMS